MDQSQEKEGDRPRRRTLGLTRFSLHLQPGNLAGLVRPSRMKTLRYSNVVSTLGMFLLLLTPTAPARAAGLQVQGRDQ
jgi:hypothetical protein